MSKRFSAVSEWLETMFPHLMLESPDLLKVDADSLSRYDLEVCVVLAGCVVVVVVVLVVFSVDKVLYIWYRRIWLLNTMTSKRNC